MRRPQSYDATRPASHIPISTQSPGSCPQTTGVSQGSGVDSSTTAAAAPNLNQIPRLGPPSLRRNSPDTAYHASERSPCRADHFEENRLGSNKLWSAVLRRFPVPCS